MTNKDLKLAVLKIGERPRRRDDQTPSEAGSLVVEIEHDLPRSNPLSKPASGEKENVTSHARLPAQTHAAKATRADAPLPTSATRPMGATPKPTKFMQNDVKPQGQEKIDAGAPLGVARNGSLVAKAGSWIQ